MKAPQRVWTTLTSDFIFNYWMHTATLGRTQPESVYAESFLGNFTVILLCKIDETVPICNLMNLKVPQCAWRGKMCAGT